MQRDDNSVSNITPRSLVVITRSSKARHKVIKQRPVHKSISNNNNNKNNNNNNNNNKNFYSQNREKET